MRVANLFDWSLSYFWNFGFINLFSLYRSLVQLHSRPVIIFCMINAKYLWKSNLFFLFSENIRARKFKLESTIQSCIIHILFENLLCELTLTLVIFDKPCLNYLNLQTCSFSQSLYLNKFINHKFYESNKSIFSIFKATWAYLSIICVFRLKEISNKKCLCQLITFWKSKILIHHL